MTLTASLLGASLLVIACGGVYVYRALLAIIRVLKQINRQLLQINGKLPSPGIINSLLVNLTGCTPHLVAPCCPILHSSEPCYPFGTFSRAISPTVAFVTRK